MLIKKPSELIAKPTITAMIYGQPGIGKTTLACSAPAPVLLDYDGGVTRLNGAHQVDTVQIGSWDDTQQAIKEIVAAKRYKTIIIDTVGKMLSYMEEYIKQTDNRLKQSDGALTLKGYGKRKQMFIQLLKDVTMLGLNIIFVAHEREERQGDNIIVRPEISGSAANDLVKELELVGYMQAVGNDRTITFDPSERYYTKNTCNMHGVLLIPNIVDNTGNAVGDNNFFCRVVYNYVAQQQRNIERNKAYEVQMSDVTQRVAAITDATGANDFVKWAKGVEWINNAKGRALQALENKCNELGLTLKNGKYVQSA